MSDLIDRLQNELFRFDCPEPLLLQAYYWETLAAEQSTPILAHVTICPHCSAELETLQAFIEEEEDAPRPAAAPTSPDWLKAAKLLIATLLPPSTETAGQYAYRGAEKSSQIFEAGAFIIEASFRPNERGQYTVLGQVMTGGEDVTSGKAELQRANVLQREAVHQVSIDANGGFHFVNIASGLYQLTLNYVEQKVVIPVLRVATEL